ncbi:MAG: acetylpolyamine aminohydrolase [Legionella sp.]|nr:acetylpolyamine aminohydrolase [Legionella sp.]
MRKTLFGTASNDFNLKMTQCIKEIQKIDFKVENYPLILNKYIKLLENAFLNKQFENLNQSLKDSLHLNYKMLLNRLNESECCIQIPSVKDLSYMTGMLAGENEDQKERLTHMIQTVQKHSVFPLVTTDTSNIPKFWQDLFELIDKGTMDGHIAKILKHLRQIPRDNVLNRSILEVHPIGYLEQVIQWTIKAKKENTLNLNNDIIITPKTFEILIKDIITTLLNPAKIKFSFGLPSHHAFNSEASGFCVFNKTAIVLHYTHLTQQSPIKHVIIGTDVNRDNGLCHVLRKGDDDLDICHVDIFDSRVYPNQNEAIINKEFKTHKIVKDSVSSWSSSKYRYFVVDLSKIKRISTSMTIHPALDFALNILSDKIIEAQNNNEKIMLYLPTGWDSHQNETAYCSQYFGNKKMTRTENTLCRFNNQDMLLFYERICNFYLEYPHIIAGIYWGLEGGYNTKMYEHQIQLMLEIVGNQLAECNNNSQVNPMEM